VPDTASDTFVRFTGMKAAGEFDELPTLGDRWTFTVTAQCNKAAHEELMTDGHHRTVVGMKILDVAPGNIEPAPEDPQLDLLADDDSDDD
jgi:hypothetical protein